MISSLSLSKLNEQLIAACISAFHLFIQCLSLVRTRRCLTIKVNVVSVSILLVMILYFSGIILNIILTGLAYRLRHTVNQ